MSGNGKQEHMPVEQTSPPQQTITIEEVNGRLTELTELNQMLTARCAQFRGQIAQKDANIARLLQELNALKSTKPEGKQDG